MLPTFAFLLIAPVSGLPFGEVQKSLMIVTTQRIRDRSAVLGKFVEEKKKRGFVVYVATEIDFGGEGVTGMDKALTIRQWLKNAYEGYSFLLLVGDAHPKYGDVPMVTVWPRHTYLSSNCAGIAVDCRSCETDYLYADLTGNWDLNGNGQYGETELDEGDGGIDFEPELFVGRIPVFFDDMRELDRVLDNAIGYMNQTQDATSYRRKILLPAAFYYFKGQQMVNYTVPENIDGADTTEWFIHKVLSRYPGFTATRMYEQEGHVPSAHPSEIALTRENLVEEWAKGYGMVFWFGHGLEREVSRVVWVEDANGNDMAEGGEMTGPTMIHSDDAVHIASGRPAFVTAVSCEVGSAETPHVIAHSLLKQGAAIGMIGSTSVTPGSATDWLDLQSELDTGTTGGDSVGIRFYERLMQGEYAGKAFFDAKVELGVEGEIEPMAGKMMLNYYGDPSLTLYDVIDDVEETPDSTSPVSGRGSGGCAYTGDRGGPVGLVLLLGFLFLRSRRARRKKAG